MNDARTGSPARVAILAVAAIVVAQGLGVWGLLAARRQTREAAERNVETQATLLARRIDAQVAALRSDVAALAQSPPLEKFLTPDEDPLVRRWNRLDAESSLLLFLETHPEIGKISLVDGEGGVLLGAMRRTDASTLFSPERPPAPEPGWRSVRWTLGESDELGVEAWLDPQRLLSRLVPGLEERVRFVDSGEDPGPVPAGLLRARTGLETSPGSAGPGWEIVWTEPVDAPFAALASWSEGMGRIVLVQVVLVLLTVVLGVLALRQTRRAVILDAERRRQEEVRELERQLVHSERLASVGRMAAGLAHEINNPLGGAANYLELVRDDLEAGDVPGALAGVDRVAHGIERASGVIREVLSFSAPGGGEGPKRTIDLVPLIERSAEFVRNQSRFEGVEIRTELGDEALLVEGNPVTLGQVFLNLLLNGVEAQARDLSRARVFVRLAERGHELVLLVEDHGPGIPAEVRESLFEPFVSTKGSTGLGLAVCRRIVEEHGGGLEAENGARGGAVFRLVLPASREEANGPEVTA